MPVHHVDVTGEPLRITAGMAAPGSAIWFEIRPNLARSAVIAGDILTALGKRRDVAGVGRNANEDIALAIAWLHSYDASGLVATEAQRLSVLVLKHLVRLAQVADLPLWLLHRAPRTDLFWRQLERHHAHPMRRIDVPSAHVEDSQWPYRRPTLGVVLPSAGFQQFISACRTTLPRKGYLAVMERHRATFQAATEILDRDGVDEDVIASVVSTALLTGPHDDLLITDIRAIQLALWHHAIYLKTNLAALLASPERQLDSAETVDRLLVVYRQPHRPVAIALSARQVGVTDIAALRIRDVRPDHSVVIRAGRRYALGAHTTRAVRALLHLRTTRTRDPNAPLLDVPPRAISLALNEASVDLDIRVHGRRSERHVHPRRWLKALGLTIHDLS